VGNGPASTVQYPSRVADPTRYCSAACRRAAARQREAVSGPLAAHPAENPCEGTCCRAHVCEAALRRLERRLDELARHLSDADTRLMARAMRDALREDGSER
jgi:hypothetical protein